MDTQNTKKEEGKGKSRFDEFWTGSITLTSLDRFNLSTHGIWRVGERNTIFSGLEMLKVRGHMDQRGALPKCLPGVGAFALQPHSLHPGPNLEGDSWNFKEEEPAETWVGNQAELPHSCPGRRSLREERGQVAAPQGGGRMGRSPWTWNLEALGDPGVSPHFCMARAAHHRSCLPCLGGCSCSFPHSHLPLASQHCCSREEAAKARWSS